MTARRSNTANAYEGVLTVAMGATDLTAVVDATSGGPPSPCYLVIDPESPSKREYIWFDGTFASNTFVTTGLANRYLAGSAAVSGISHDVGAKVRSATVAQLYDDLFDYIDAVGAAAAAGGGPIGAIAAWPTATAPTGWLLMNGAAISRTTYADLFALIGTTYGAGNGTTTFNLPNAKGKTLIGLDAAQTEFDALAETGGAKTVTLDATMIPAHTHSDGSLATSTDGAHVHDVEIEGPPGGGAFVVVSASTFGGAVSTQTGGSHSHDVTGTTGSAGGGAAHANLPPYLVLNYIIKAL